MRTCAAVVLIGGLLTACFAAAKPKAKVDQVEALITKALAAYKAGKAATAIDDLQKAISLMQKSLQKGMAGFLPAAPKGWTAGKIDSTSMSMGTAKDAGAWRQVSRRYTRTSDKLRVTITITNSPQLIQATKAASKMYQSPQMIAMLNRDPNMKVELVSQHGWSGWIVISKGKSAQATALAKGCMLSVSASKDDEAALKAFWKAIDLKGLSAGQTEPVRK